MRPGLFRAGAVAVLGAAGYLAYEHSPQLPERRPAEILQQAAVASSGSTRTDTLGKGETLLALLRRDGLSDSAAAGAVRVATALDHAHVPDGMLVMLHTDHPGAAASEIDVQLAADRQLKLQRTGMEWTGAEETLPWVTDTIAVGGEIHSNLYAAVDASAKDLLPKAAREALTWSLADVFEYRVDMSRDLQRGDVFKVIAERSTTPNGSTKITRILAATFSLSGSVIDAVRFASNSVTGDFFDQDGKSMHGTFLSAPLEFRRISSVFGSRVHPILGDVRMHNGMDYAAPAGTPVRAIGDGIVTRAGWSDGYGNLIEIRHPNGFVTRYGHMRAFVKGIHPGVHVGIGEQIGFVGSTGLSTGPHLHFEVLVNGEPRDPRSALRRTGGDPIPDTERLAFAALRDRMLASLGTVGVGALSMASQ